MSDKEKIITNKIQCLVCGDIIESTHMHHFVRCKCGKVAVDGGHDYLKRIGRSELWKELSHIKKDITFSRDESKESWKILDKPKVKDPIDDLINKIKNL